ncbi:MAG: hypothetical protein AVDCRST_MAG19-1869 [uncultured Thermomicrobiales bacterium]|uniref:Uncharacterized protein n=1 Tax=uncultured Thermomicrobiales bacterium TaxID=1645740 RepID=A0A6J4UVP1_9BACT|nr:MAG: hypothetical protein AVDCRST_MAG19-1869 [uncultured Thermomicrobiales bacterium]
MKRSIASPLAGAHLARRVRTSGTGPIAAIFSVASCQGPSRHPTTGPASEQPPIDSARAARRGGRRSEDDVD